MGIRYHKKAVKVNISKAMAYDMHQKVYARVHTVHSDKEIFKISYIYISLNNWRQTQIRILLYIDSQHIHVYV